ncbi:hypothetical protein FKM82_011678 [Ascaphus truei]
MGSELGVMSDNSALSLRARRLLCSSGGSMELGQLGRSLGLNAQQVEQLVEAEKGRSLMLHVQEEARVAVSRSAVRVCTDREQKCGGTCERLHLCRYHVLGSCSRSPCKFNHEISTPQNVRVLQEQQLDGLSIGELRQLLLQNNPGFLPEVCLHYNRGDGPHGSCTFKNSCSKLHICQHFLQGDCRFGSKCKRSHDLNDGETVKKWGLSDTLLPQLLGTYTNASVLRDNKVPSPRKEEHPPSKQGPSQSQRPSSSEHMEEICLYFIRNSCSFKDRCVRNHYHLPYKWQMYVSNNWKDFSDIQVEAIEQAYCDPNSRSDLDFDTMTYKSNASSKVRRFSTPSSASKPPHFILTTDWLWYWRDECNKWIEYGKENDSHVPATISSGDLENMYLSDTTTIQFKAGKQEYELNFKDMVQKNLRYGTERKVCRRPKFVSAKDVGKRKSRKSETSKEEDKSTPTYWDKGQIPETGYKLVPVAASSEEYKKVEALFQRTLPSNRIHSLQRIQNPALWEVYQWQKEQMKKQNGGKEVDERQLFHGTNDQLTDAICQQNFDWRICGAHGTAYGKGSYFARDSSYSHNYSSRTVSRTRIMFVARVLVGDFTNGRSSYLRPPGKTALSSSSSTNFYDSCVDSMSKPSIFVVFEKHQIYPEYLIKYSS